MLCNRVLLLALAAPLPRPDSRPAASRLPLGSQAPPQAEEVCHGSSTPCTLDTTLTDAQRPLRASPVASPPPASPRTRPSPRPASRPVVLRPLVSSLPPGGEFQDETRRKAKATYSDLVLGFWGTWSERMRCWVTELRSTTANIRVDEKRELESIVSWVPWILKA